MMTPAEVAPWLLLVMEALILGAGLYLLMRGQQAAGGEHVVTALGIKVSSPTPGMAISAFAVVALIVTIMVGVLTGPETNSAVDVQATDTDTTTPSGSTTCWDGSRTEYRSTCPTPTGRAGLASVFPSLDEACEPTLGPIRAGKAEVFWCDHQHFLIRYTRWEPGYDWSRYYDLENPGASRAAWTTGGEPAGRQWTSEEVGPDEDMPFQWSAAYADAAYSVSVEGTTRAARTKGIDRVVAVAPSQIGLE